MASLSVPIVLFLALNQDNLGTTYFFQMGVFRYFKNAFTSSPVISADIVWVGMHSIDWLVSRQHLTSPARTLGVALPHKVLLLDFLFMSQWVFPIFPFLPRLMNKNLRLISHCKIFFFMKLSEKLGLTVIFAEKDRYILTQKPKIIW